MELLALLSILGRSLGFRWSLRSLFGFRRGLFFGFLGLLGCTLARFGVELDASLRLLGSARFLARLALERRVADLRVLGSDVCNFRCLLFQCARVRDSLGLFFGDQTREIANLAVEARLLARQIAQVVEPSTSDITTRLDIDFGDQRRLHGEDTLDADAARNLSNSEGLPDPSATAAHHQALKDLNSLFVALPNIYMDSHRVADLEGR